MQPIPGSQLDGIIAFHRDSMRRSKASLEEAMREIQKVCEHQVVVERPYSSGFRPQRICRRCLYLEEGSHWSGKHIWRCEDGETKLDNHPNRIVTEVNSDKFYAIRDMRDDL